MCLVRFSKYSEWAPFVLRLSLGIVLAWHGYAKLTGEGGIGAVGQFFAGIGIPAAGFFAVVVTFLELIGGIGLMLGMFTRYFSALLAIQFAYIVLGSLFTNKPKPSFIGGFEFDFLILAVAIALLLVGNGKKLSVEQLLLKKEL